MISERPNHWTTAPLFYLTQGFIWSVPLGKWHAGPSKGTSFSATCAIVPRYSVACAIVKNNKMLNCNICRVYVSFTDNLFTLFDCIYVIFTLTWCLSTLALTGPL